jgi:hypothetical protein
MNNEEGRLINIGDTSLYVVARGRGYPIRIKRSSNSLKL